MATFARIVMPNLGQFYSTASAGTSPGFSAAAGGGDFFPISSGQGTLIAIRTAGTGSTVTLDSVLQTAYGTDVNVTITMSATDEKWVFIDNDGYGRFDQGPGANVGLVAVTYSSVTTMTIAAVTIQ